MVVVTPMVAVVVVSLLVVVVVILVLVLVVAAVLLVRMPCRFLNSSSCNCSHLCRCTLQLPFSFPLRRRCRLLTIVNGEDLRFLCVHVDYSTALLLVQVQVRHLRLQVPDLGGQSELGRIHEIVGRCRSTHRRSIAFDGLTADGTGGVVRFRSQLLPAGQFVKLLVVVPLGGVEVAGQTVRVQVVVAFGLCELVAVLKTVQTDYALPGRKIAVGQVFAHHVNQIEYDGGAQVLV